MSEYILFAFDRYYPNGGMDDKKLAFEDIEELRIWSETHSFGYDRYQILDLTDLKISEHRNNSDYDKPDEEKREEFLTWFEVNFN